MQTTTLAVHVGELLGLAWSVSPTRAVLVLLVVLALAG